MTLELIVFTGLQASGKSTFFRERLASTHVQVSKDAWPNALNREARQRRAIEAALGGGRSVVVDNTNPSPAERAPLVALARTLGARAISYWFVTTMADAKARNALRSGRARVPDVGLYSVAKRLVPPGPEEGFDELFEVRLVEGGFTIARL